MPGLKCACIAIEHIPELGAQLQECLACQWAQKQHDGQTILRYSAEVPKCMKQINKSSYSNSFSMDCNRRCSQIEMPSDSKKEFGCMEPSR